MRRTVFLVLLDTVLLLSVASLLPRGARTQVPGEPVVAPVMDASQYTLGELVEGNVPLSRFGPDVLPDAPEGITAEGIPVPEGYSVDFRSYPSPEEVNAFLEELEADYPELVEVYEIGTSWQGRAIHAVRVANEAAPRDPADRPAMYIDGQHHAREMIGNQTALYTLWWLVNFYGEDPLVTYLVDTRAVYFVPSVNVDGNHIVLNDYQDMRRTANPACCDDDLNAENEPVPDGQFDEDYSVGFGYGADEVFLYHFDQEWADQHPGNPFQRGWWEHQERDREHVGRFTGALGGTRELIPRFDMDGDGLQDEDEIGGVDANRNYDSHWETGDNNTGWATYHGPEVFSEPETRAVRDFLAGTAHLATGLSYHSGVDVNLHPWGWSRDAELPDARTFELLSRKASELTEVNGFPGSPHTWTARGLYPGSGSTMDYLYEKRGIYAWSPEVYGGSMMTRIERLGATGTFTVGQSVGFGFNPPPDTIPATTDRWNRWALYLLAATPNIELNSIAVQGDDLVITLGNDGILAVDVTLSLDGAAGERLGGDAGATRNLRGIQNRWVFPLEAVAREGNRLTATAELRIGTVPHEVETAEWVFTITGDGVRLDEGEAVPFRQLGTHFGGWWADEKWDEPGRYHRPPGQPIRVAPPVYFPLLARDRVAPPSG